MANTSDVIQYVTDKVFRTTWNNIRAERRINILMSKVRSSYITGSIPIGSEFLALPDTGPFMVLYTNRQFTDIIYTPADKWVSAAEILTSYNAYLHLYGIAGRVLPKTEVYLYTPSGGGQSLIAVKYSAINVCRYSISDAFYATIYMDSDQQNIATIKSFVIPSTNASSTILSVRSYVASCMSKSVAATHVFYNGDYVTPSVYMTMTPSAQSRIDVVFDPNVVGEYVVDYKGGFGYASDKYQDYRTLLHCPKSINPNNAVITHNTIEIFVRDKSTGFARYLHRTDTNAVTQVTHNDIAVNTTVLEAFIDSMGTADVELVVKVRTHSNDNVLLNDAHFLKALYLLDDDTIVKCLLGTEDGTLTFWTAQSLESSGYVSLMFDTPNEYTSATLDELVDALGMPQILAMVSENIAHIKRHPSNKTVVMNVPVALWDVAVYPIVYVNGIFVSSDMYSYTRSSTISIVVSFKDTFYLPVDAIVSIRLLEHVAGDYAPVVWVPSVNEKTITVTGKECSVYKVITVEETALPSGGSSTTGYLPLSTSGGTMVIQQSGTSYAITVGSSLYGETLIIYRGNAVIRRDVTTDIDDAISECRPLCYALTQEASDGRMVPALNHSVDLFLNRSYLTKNIGYTLTTLSVGTAIVSKELAVTDRRYLLESGNILTIIYHTEDDIISDSGYAADGKLSYDTSVTPWASDLGGIHAHGVITTAYDNGQWLTINDTFNVTEYNLRLSIPDGLSDIMSGYADTITAYKNRLSIINAYLKTALPIDDERIIISESYYIYSPYTCAVIADVVSGKLEISNDPNVTKFKVQFEPYAHYKLVDIAFTRPSTYDLMFIDILPNTGDASLAIDQYAALRRFVNMVLSDDAQTEGNMING